MIRIIGLTWIASCLMISDVFTQQGWYLLGPVTPGWEKVEHVAVGWISPSQYRLAATCAKTGVPRGGIAYFEPDTGWRHQYMSWYSGGNNAGDYLFSEISPWDAESVYIGYSRSHGSSSVNKAGWRSGLEHCCYAIGGGAGRWSMIFIISTDSIVLGSIEGVLFRSTDRGATWGPPPYTSIDPISPYNRQSQGLVHSNTEMTSVIYGSGFYTSGPPYRGATLYRSSDLGTTWDSLFSVEASLAGFPPFNVYGVGDTILLGVRSQWGDEWGDKGIYRSTDDGETWAKVYSGKQVAGLEPSRVTPDLILAATEEGILQSDDYGLTWMCFNCNLPTNRLMNFVLSPYADQAFIATETHGVIVAEQPVTDVDDGTGIPSTFTLEQNFPNPFNPSTEIRYGLAHRTHVSITVFDALGRKVATLRDEDQSAGRHTVNMDGTSLTCGIYFYRMQAGSFTATRKLLLVR